MMVVQPSQIMTLVRLLLILSTVILFIHASEIKIGFVFVLTTQRKFGGFQQVLLWSKYFEKVPKSQYACIVVNWPLGEELPSFVDTVHGHETDYGGVQYIESFLTGAQILIRNYQATGAILLSGACLPFRPFTHFYWAVHSRLSERQSILCEFPIKTAHHHARFASLAKPRIHRNEWVTHLGQGYLLHESLISLMIKRWKEFSSELRNVSSIDEHYVSYFLRAFDHDTTHSDSIIAKYSLDYLQSMCLLHTEWNKGVVKTWSDHLTIESIKKLREEKEGTFFIRKILHSCKVDEEVIMP